MVQGDDGAGERQPRERAGGGPLPRLSREDPGRAGQPSLQLTNLRAQGEVGRLLAPSLPPLPGV